MKAFYILALAALASANVVINNGCPETLHVDHVGPGDAGLPSFDIAPGNTLVQPFYGDGIAVKIAREESDGVLQLEYSLTDHFYWDLSDLDGGGAGVVVSPFRDMDVRVTPTGNGANEGENKCFPLDCPAGQTCQEAYQDPHQEATRVCPADTGDLILDLCLGGVEAVDAAGPVSEEEEDESAPASEETAEEAAESAEESDEHEHQWGHGRQWNGRYDYSQNWHGHKMVRRARI